MDATWRSIERLRNLAAGDLPNFARCLEKLLDTDFENTFYYVKTQKLLFKRRSSQWISDLECELQPWLQRASLKGKQRSQFKRYLLVCKSLQHLLEIVDEQSSKLRIWRASTEDLLQALFESVEELRFKQSREARDKKLTYSNDLNVLKHMEIVGSEHRYHCDYITRILGQIAHFGIKESGNVQLTPSDIQDAVALVAVDEMLLHILDCYTYKNFRVTVGEKHLKMHGTTSPTEASYTWSALRENSRELLDNHQIAQAIEKAEEFAKSTCRECDSFASFLESVPGVQLFNISQLVRRAYIRILRRDVSELIDLDMIIRTHCGSFKVRELIECWSVLFQIGICAGIWCKLFQKSNAALIPNAQLISIVEKSLGCNAEQGRHLISQFTLDPKEPNGDPFFRPLIKLNADQRLIAASIIETSRFSRNLFTIAIREGNVNFSAKGLKPLKELMEEFTTAGFKGRMNIPITRSGRTVTDVDIAAAKDGFLFVGQVKVLIIPDTHYDDWKVLENLKKAAAQLKLTMEHLPMIRDCLGLNSEEVVVVPFLLTNVWVLTGTNVEGFKIVDFSYLSGLLRGGEVWKVGFDPVPTREIIKLINGRYPTGAELSRLVLKPIHESMFEKPILEDRSFEFGDWTVTIPVDTLKNPVEKPLNKRSKQTTVAIRKGRNQEDILGSILRAARRS